MTHLSATQAKANLLEWATADAAQHAVARRFMTGAAPLAATAVVTLIVAEALRRSARGPIGRVAGLGLLARSATWLIPIAVKAFGSPATGRADRAAGFRPQDRVESRPG